MYYLVLKNCKVKKIDLLAIHGINTAEHLHQAIRDGGCIDILRNFQKENLIGSIGFSTHGKSSLIEKAISTNLFDYVNLHWYYINQENTKVINLANKYDLGVFIISPTDKGGHLHTPSDKMLELCEPLHPIVFNDLFCLRNPNVPYFVRYNACQALLIDIALIIISYLLRIFPIVELGSIIFIFTLCIFIYSISQCIYGVEPEIPLISKSVRMQI